MSRTRPDTLPLGQGRGDSPGAVRAFAPRMDDTALVHAITRGDRAAAAEMFDRYAPRVRRVLLRILGPDPDLSDLVQDVFVHALRDLPKLRDPAALGGWLTGMAVHVARRAIRRRSRWRWLRFFAPEDLPEMPAAAADEAASEELRATYGILGGLPEDERIAFSLRFLEGMELTEVAAACGVSLATIKRRLRRAEDAFRAEAARHPALSARLSGLSEEQGGSS